MAVLGTDEQRFARIEVERIQREILKLEDEVLKEILPEAFAAVREASKRTIGLRHYDVQLIGGMVLNSGSIAEMKTGEGKTLVATLPLYLNSLSGRGAHLVTPNDYLSKVGLQLMGPIYHLLGVSAAVIQNSAAGPDKGSFLYDPDFPSADDRFQALRPIPRREAYQADITYGTNNEFGFDYLRDNMVQSLAQLSQRELHYAIVDEVDNILIDEARTPLIISGEARESSNYYVEFAALVRTLQRREGLRRQRERARCHADRRRHRAYRAAPGLREPLQPGALRDDPLSRQRAARPCAVSAATATTSCATTKSSSSTSSPAA